MRTLARFGGLFTFSLLIPCGLVAQGCAIEEDVAEDEGALTTNLSVASIRSKATFERISIPGGSFGQAGRSAKFFIDLRTPSKPVIRFINANYTSGGKTPDYAKYHYDFGKREMGVTDSGTVFNEATYFSEKKRYVAGTLVSYHIDEKSTLYGIQLYPDDVANEGGILEIAKIVRGAFSISGAKLAFVSTGAQQTTKTIQAAMKAARVETRTIDEILGTLQFLPLNPGEAWGVLRVFPKDVGTLKPSDIVVFDELPLDLSVVAGTITKVFQDVTSHVNLKAKERGTPNMVLRDFDKQATLLALKDKPVHLVVKKDQYVIEPTTQAIVDAKIKEQLSKPWIPLKIVNETRVLPYESMCGPTSSAPLCLESRYAFGGKAAGMAFLTHKGVVGRTVDKGSQSERLGYNIVPPGFGVPISSYQAFVNGNPVLAAKLKTLIAKEKTGALSPNERIKLAEEVQALFYKGKIPTAQWTAITTELAKFQAANPNVKKIKVRSSSNAEDIPKFDGAGLHDSFAAEFDEVDLPDLSCAIEEKIENGVVTKLKVDPKTVQCAVKAVYGSLWNARAIDERTFGRVDHETASMGLAVVPAYDTDADIASNGVVITRPVNGDGVVGYTLSLQKGENLVTNPEPGTISQMTLAVFADLKRAPRFTLVRSATPVLGGPPLTTSVLAEKDLLTITEIVKKTEIAYCKAKPSYFPGQNCNYVWIDSDKPAALDMEFKFLENGHFVLKQLREFHGE